MALTLLHGANHPNPITLTQLPTLLVLVAASLQLSHLTLKLTAGAEIGLVTTAAALLGAAVLTADPSMRCPNSVSVVLQSQQTHAPRQAPRRRPRQCMGECAQAGDQGGHAESSLGSTD